MGIFLEEGTCRKLSVLMLAISDTLSNSFGGLTRVYAYCMKAVFANTICYESLTKKDVTLEWWQPGLFLE